MTSQSIVSRMTGRLHGYAASFHGVMAGAVCVALSCPACGNAGAGQSIDGGRDSGRIDARVPDSGHADGGLDGGELADAGPIAMDASSDAIPFDADCLPPNELVAIVEWERVDWSGLNCTYFSG